MRTLTEAEARALPGAPPLGVVALHTSPLITRGAFPLGTLPPASRLRGAAFPVMRLVSFLGTSCCWTGCGEMQTPLLIRLAAFLCRHAAAGPAGRTPGCRGGKAGGEAGRGRAGEGGGGGERERRKREQPPVCSDHSRYRHGDT